jgi:hypothetical protein
MGEVEPGVDVTDNCDDRSLLQFAFGDCVCDQPGNDTGDGNTDFDCFVDPLDSQTLWVRSERQGNDPDGRHCFVEIIVTDSAGNQSPSTTVGNVYIPHDQSPEEICLRPDGDKLTIVKRAR